jgi:hypothetical protein
MLTPVYARKRGGDFEARSGDQTECIKTEHNPQEDRLRS